MEIFVPSTVQSDAGVVAVLGGTLAKITLPVLSTVKNFCVEIGVIVSLVKGKVIPLLIMTLPVLLLTIDVPEIAHNDETTGVVTTPTESFTKITFPLSSTESTFP